MTGYGTTKPDGLPRGRDIPAVSPVWSLIHLSGGIAPVGVPRRRSQNGNRGKHPCNPSAGELE